MNLIKNIIVSDLDETFLNYDGSLPNNSKKFFSLIKNDTFIIATSRHISNILSLNIPVDNKYYAICSDGAIIVKIENKEYKVINETLLMKDKINIFNNLKLLNKELFIFTGINNDFKIYHISKDNENQNLRNFLQIPNELRKIIRVNIDDIKFLEKILSFDVRSITLFINNEQSDFIFDKIPDFVGTQKIIYDETRINLNHSWIDIIDEETNKYFGLKKLLSKEHMKGKIFAFGNGTNDMDFFDLADKTFVPINAINSLKNKATYISEQHCGDTFLTDIIAQLVREKEVFNG